MTSSFFSSSVSSGSVGFLTFSNNLIGLSHISSTFTKIERNLSKILPAMGPNSSMGLIPTNYFRLGSYSSRGSNSSRGPKYSKYGIFSVNTEYIQWEGTTLFSIMSPFREYINASTLSDVMGDRSKSRTRLMYQEFQTLPRVIQYYCHISHNHINKSRFCP